MQQTAASNSTSQSMTLPCNGQRCPQCRLCREWYFTGDWAAWIWLCHLSDWNNQDWAHYYQDRMIQLFKMRPNAKCNFWGTHFLRRPDIPHLHRGFDACLCADNRE